MEYYFVVGTPVMIRPWQDLVSRFGLDSEGGIAFPDYVYFPREWEVYCGRAVWVEDVFFDEDDSLDGYEVSGIPDINYLPAAAVEDYLPGINYLPAAAVEE